MTKQLPQAPDDSCLNEGSNLFEPWTGDPFAGMERKIGQLDHECASCGKTVRHMFYPDVPRGWFFFHDADTDLVHVVCRPQCAAKFHDIDVTGLDIRAIAQTIVKAGWKYRRPEKADKTAAAGLGGGWGRGSL